MKVRALSKTEYSSQLEWRIPISIFNFEAIVKSALLTTSNVVIAVLRLPMLLFFGKVGFENRG